VSVSSGAGTKLVYERLIEGVRESADAWLPFAVGVLCIVVILPTMWSGWYGDDAFFSNLSGQLAADNTTLWTAMASAFWLWFHVMGRFYPLAIVERYIVFALFTNVVAYKLLLIISTVACVELFRRCVAAYANVGFANLAALLVLILFQERGYHDSILAYNAMPQTVALAILGSLLAFRSAIVRNDSKRMAAAAFLFLVAALVYEDAYGFCVLYPLAAYATRKNLRDAARLSAPFIAIATALIAFDVALRAWAHLSAHDGYAMDFSLAAVARTAAVQIVAALPLSYWLVDPLVIFRLRPAFFLETPGSLPPPIVFPLFLLATWFAVERARPKNGIGGWMLCGTSVLVVAALPIAFVVKYQNELRLGLGYLPVFLEAFGVALAIAALIGTIASHRRFVQAPLVILVALIGTLTQTANARLASELQPSRIARGALERQLANGLFARFRDCHFVASARTFDWIALDDRGPDGISTRGMFYAYGKQRATLVAPGDPRARCRLQYDAGSQSWELRQVP
jgi:hypothetical protein